MQHIDLASARWRKSTYSGQGGECVEVAPDFPGAVPVRDSKDPSGPALVFPAAAFTAFVDAVRAGEFGTL
ncbi:DUF397 domain-containing protein [Kitasatospora sp. NPDC004723]|uniref:DUF397 domain-containing protein n=1 Tax=Kitasatospora sp. NPDC004723 TaxID=3154288 RepID=UPI0033AB35DB